MAQRLAPADPEPTTSDVGPKADAGGTDPDPIKAALLPAGTPDAPGGSDADRAAAQAEIRRRLAGREMLGMAERLAAADAQPRPDPAKADPAAAPSGPGPRAADGGRGRAATPYVAFLADSPPWSVPARPRRKHDNEAAAPAPASRAAAPPAPHPPAPHPPERSRPERLRIVAERTEQGRRAPGEGAEHERMGKRRPLAIAASLSLGAALLLHGGGIAPDGERSFADMASAAESAPPAGSGAAAAPGTGRLPADRTSRENGMAALRVSPDGRAAAASTAAAQATMPNGERASSAGGGSAAAIAPDPAEPAPYTAGDLAIAGLRHASTTDAAGAAPPVDADENAVSAGRRLSRLQAPGIPREAPEAARPPRSAGAASETKIAGPPPEPFGAAEGGSPPVIASAPLPSPDRRLPQLAVHRAAAGGGVPGAAALVPMPAVAGAPPAPLEVAAGAAPAVLVDATPLSAGRLLSNLTADHDNDRLVARGGIPGGAAPAPEPAVADPPPAPFAAPAGAAPAALDGGTPISPDRRPSLLAAYQAPPGDAAPTGDGAGQRGTAGLVPELVERDPALVEEELGIGPQRRREIQRRLTLAGFSTGGVDGIFGERTRTAIRDWQEARELAGSGYLDAEQIAALEVETAGAYNSFVAAARERAKTVTTAHRTPKRRPEPARGEGRGGRYVDAEGCLREADGSYVPFFKWRCR